MGLPSGIVREGVENAKRGSVQSQREPHCGVSLLISQRQSAFKKLFDLLFFPWFRFQGEQRDQGIDGRSRSRPCLLAPLSVLFPIGLPTFLTKPPSMRGAALESAQARRQSQPARGRELPTPRWRQSTAADFDFAPMETFAHNTLPDRATLFQLRIHP